MSHGGYIDKQKRWTLKKIIKRIILWILIISGTLLLAMLGFTLDEMKFQHYAEKQNIVPCETQKPSSK